MLLLVYNMSCVCNQSAVPSMASEFLSIYLSILPLHQLNKVLGRNIISQKVSLIRNYIAMI